jgi:hypothetical protein
MRVGFAAGAGDLPGRSGPLHARTVPASPVAALHRAAARLAAPPDDRFRVLGARRLAIGLPRQGQSCGWLPTRGAITLTPRGWEPIQQAEIHVEHDRQDRDPDHARPHPHEGAGSRDCSVRGKGIAGSRRSGRSLSGNAIVARVARFGGGAPVSLREARGSELAGPRRLSKRFGDHEGGAIFRASCGL